MISNKINTILEQLLWETAPDAIIIFDENNIIRYVNKSIFDLFGYVPEELLNQHINKIQPPELAIRHEHGIKMYLKSGVRKLDWKAANAIGVHKSGKQIPIEISFSHFVVDNENFFAGIFRNTTERIENQTKLEAKNNELEQINTELDHFVYSVSHDLRAPLLSTLGLINICKIDNTFESYKSHVSLMEKNIKKLDLFIHEILDYARNARIENNLKEVEIRELINETIDQLKYVENHNFINFIINIESKPILLMDEMRIKIILHNLISNSIKFQNNYIENRYIKITFSDLEPDKILVTVEDNGVGIHPERIDRIFEMFYKASQNPNGSGLGLYIVKVAIKKLGGSIKVESIPNQKTTFFVTICK